MALVPAICTQCNAQLEVDNSQEAAVCKYCGTPFIVEKAINNYVVKNTINVENASFNVSGVNIDNLLRRALEFEVAGDIEKALDYCNKVLDVDIDNKEAREYIARLEKAKGINISGVIFSEEVGNEIINLVKQGSKVTAIKVFRENTGWGLKEAKDAIDEFELNLKGAAPNRNVSNVKMNVSNNTSGANNKSGGCYVATAVYGSYDCPEVWTLRRFRDNILAENWFGRLFIHTYYAISPKLVKLFGKKNWFKNIWKPMLDSIVVKLNESGIDNTPYNDKKW